MTSHNFISKGLLGVIFLINPGWALADVVQDQLTQLEVNKQNSTYNYEQYKKNMEQSSQNIVEMNKTIVDLRSKKQMTQKELQANSIGQKQLEQKEVELINLQKSEEEKNKKDQLLIEQIQADIQKRNQIIQQYADQMKTLQSEKTAWIQQRSDLEKLLSEQTTIEKTNLDERQKWVDKKLANRKEAAKWLKEQQVAERTQMKFKQLGE